jgi:hypothetical protein
MCILAGIDLNSIQPWINSYLNNPNEKETIHTQINRYVIRRANNPVGRSEDEIIGNLIENDDRYVILEQSDDYNSGFTTLDDYYFEKNKHNNSNNNNDTNINSFQNIYNLIKHHYTNPLSLQELARIQIRNTMLKIDYKIKNKIENKLNLPKRLVDYLLLKEFNY